MFPMQKIYFEKNTPFFLLKCSPFFFIIINFTSITKLHANIKYIYIYKDEPNLYLKTLQEQNVFFSFFRFSKFCKRQENKITTLRFTQQMNVFTICVCLKYFD